MKKYSLEFFVGIFVVVGLLCLGYMAIKLGKMEVFSPDSYTISARFTSITGLRTGASVEVAGVPVGKVSKISLTPAAVAIVEMQVATSVVVTDDTIASVKTSGIIGDKYINLSLGGGDPLGKGDEILDTESVVDLEALISKFVFGGVE